MEKESELNTDLRVRVSEERRYQIEHLVYERSEPGDRVTVSDILRDALDEFLEEHAPGKEEREEQIEAE